MKEKIKKWYKFGLWTTEMVVQAVKKNIITPEDFLEITGIEYGGE